MPRRLAWKILRAGSAAPLREVSRVARNAGLEARDRALLRRLVGVEVRRRGSLRALVSAFARGRPNRDLAAHLRLGFAQLLFMDRIPEHAAVSETVRAAVDTLGMSKGRYVNAVLREVLRQRREGHSGDPTRDLPGRAWHFARPVFRDPQEHPLLWAEDALSMPAALMKRWEKHHGRDAARDLATLFLDEPYLSVQVVRGERDALRAEFERAGLRPVLGGHRATLLFDTGSVEAVVESTPFREGAVTIQGQTALVGAELVEAGPGERVLDLCAAPGGKTLVLAGAGADVLALDSSRTRLGQLAPTLERLHPAGRVRCVVTDAGAALGEALFDAVLVDAPCTNTGVLGQRPGARWRFGPATLASLGALQERLLARAALHVRPGGRLVYSTCSIEPQENEQRVRAFLGANPGWELAREHTGMPAALEAGGPLDGGYAARLLREG